MEDGRYVTLFLKSVRRSALTGAMAGSLLLAATASAFADTNTSAKSVAKGTNPTSGDASNTTSITKNVTTTGGLATTTSSPTVLGTTEVGKTYVKSAPLAKSGNTNFTQVTQQPIAFGGTNTYEPAAGSTSTCTATNNAFENSQMSNRMGEDMGHSGDNAHQSSATCTHSLGQIDVKQSAKGNATGHNVTLANKSDSSAKTDDSTAGAKVAADGKAKVADSGAAATTSTGNGSGGNGNGKDSAKAESKAKSASGTDATDSSAQSGNATVDFTKDTTIHTTGGDATATSSPTAEYHTTVGDTTVKSLPTAVSWNWNGINITCYPTAYGGSNSNMLSTQLTGTATNNADGNHQDSNRNGSGSGSSGSNTYKPDTKVDQHTGHTRVHQYADANASCGTINISNTFNSNASTGPSEAKADVSATGKAEIKNSGAGATSVTNGSAYEGSAGGVGGGVAIITSGGSTNIGARRGEELAAVKAAESSDDRTRIITSGGSTNITAPIAMVAGVTVPPVTPPGGVRAESVAGLAPTGRPGGFSAETEGQPAFTFLLGLILGGFGIVWIGGRRLFVRD